MLNKVFNKYDNLNLILIKVGNTKCNLIIECLKKIQQSMSRKSNCLDNLPMENFFEKSNVLRV